MTEENCVMCEEPLEVVSGSNVCINKYCDVDDPTKYKIKTKGWFSLERPNALSADGWVNWDNLAKETHPIRYWLSEDFAASVSLCKRVYITDPLDWVRYRTYNRYHRINTGLKPGWNDVPEQMLFVNFTMLVDYVEIEKASMMLRNDDVVDSRKWWQKGPLDNWRDASLGKQHLHWEMELSCGERLEYCNDVDFPNERWTVDDPTPQAISAKEQYELYTWWTELRPAREDAWDASGLGAWYEENSSPGWGVMDLLRDMDTRDRAEYDAVSETHDKLEQSYLDEDEAMLVRLVKVRQSLWT
jgi:hypothetical protein